MTTSIAHHWNSGEQTIPTRYGTAVEELIRRSSTPETGTRLALSTGYRSTVCIDDACAATRTGTRSSTRGLS